MFGKFVSLILGCVMVLVIISGGPLVWWWDRAPTRPAWTQAHFWSLRFPDWIRDPSLAVHANAQTNAARADFNTEKASFNILYGAWSQDEGSVRALGSLGVTLRTETVAAVARARSAGIAASENDRRIAALPPTPVNANCPDTDAADAEFVAYLRGITEPGALQ